MLDSTCINNALTNLFSNNYQIKKTDYAENHFGNFIIELANKESFGIRFIHDRGQLWCEVQCNSMWIMINDVFEIHGICANYEVENDYCANIALLSDAIQQNLLILKKVLNSANSQTTIQQVEELKERRAEALIKKYNNL